MLTDFEEDKMKDSTLLKFNRIENFIYDYNKASIRINFDIANQNIKSTLDKKMNQILFIYDNIKSKLRIFTKRKNKKF